MDTKFIFAVDKEIDKEVVHIVREPFAISAVTGNKIRLTNEEINHINNCKL